MKKVFALVLVVCMMLTLASFPATAATTNPKRVKIFTMGDSFTAGICEPNAYRYYIYENLIQDGGVFEFIGPSTSGDYRVTSLYNKHGGVGGAVIGCADDYTWNGSGWSTNAWSTVSNGITIKSNGNKNSIHYRLFAGSVGDEVTERAVSVEGFTSESTSETITLIDGTNSITFKYTKVAAEENGTVKIGGLGASNVTFSGHTAIK